MKTQSTNSERASTPETPEHHQSESPTDTVPERFGDYVGDVGGVRRELRGWATEAIGTGAEIV